MLLFMSIGSPVYRPTDRDNEMVGEGRDEEETEGAEWEVGGGRLFGALRSQCYLMKMK